MSLTMSVEDLKRKIRDVPDFPKPGILFKDITTLLKDKEAFQDMVELLAKPYLNRKIDVVAGIEARGFILAGALAYSLKAGAVIIRKPGKLPAETISSFYQLEYGQDSIEIHRDAIMPGQKVLMVDDVLATGGTMLAAIELVKKLGGQIEDIAFLIELEFLKGRERLKDYPFTALIKY